MPAEGHVFRIAFQIPDATEPDAYAIRAYEDERLQDIALMGPGASGVFVAEFERAAPRYEGALLSAIDALRQVFPEAQLLELKADDLVSLRDIAQRTGRTRESVRLLANGRRGPGTLPRVAGRPGLWRWHEVARWFEEELGVKVAEHRHAAFLAAVNHLLELRRVAAQGVSTPSDGRRLATLLPAELAS